MNIEKRVFKFELRENDDGTRRLAGTPIVYNKRSENLGFYEYIKPGAAREALEKSDARLLYGHNSDTLLPLARQSSGTLRVKETRDGVDIEADPPKRNPFADALMESIERGDVREMSFGFTVEEDEWADVDKDIPTRTVRKIGELFDFSYVTFAAYPDTDATLRSMASEGPDTTVAMKSLEKAKAKTGLEPDATSEDPENAPNATVEERDGATAMETESEDDIETSEVTTFEKIKSNISSW